MRVKQFVYDQSEGSAEMRNLLGGKGANIAEMQRIGVPVPDGFTVTTEACVDAMRAGGTWPEGLWDGVLDRLAALEERTGRRLGDPAKPLLVSVRSGAVFSMPGMMDTILNLGLNDAAVRGLAVESGNPRFAWDSYRRFVQMFGKVVLDVPGDDFELALSQLKRDRSVKNDTDLSAEDLEALVVTFKEIIATAVGPDLFGDDPREQLRLAINAVFESWKNPRAAVYRRANGIPDDLGTAVNVMQMVFGNLGDQSATGVCFTRNPATGVKELYGEFLINAQGEDVVAGIRTPRQLAELAGELPDAYAELLATMARLEAHYGDMQDIEFTIEQGHLYLLQTRNGKRTAQAGVRIACDMVEEGVITREQAVQRIDPNQLDQLLHPTIDPTATRDLVASGLNASPGAGVGEVVLDADTAEQRGKAGIAVILVRWETTPDDIHGVIVAQGVLTAHGGMTSHAAVVARGMGKPCVVGIDGLQIDMQDRSIIIGGRKILEGETITMDGSTGEVFAGALPLVPPRFDDYFQRITSWADQIRTLQVRANADTPEDAERARGFGAEGIGLCRTEHMFMSEDRLPAVRRMILAREIDERLLALAELAPMQQGDFEGILRAMDGLPVTIRLLDPPLHEFLPSLLEASRNVERIREHGAQGDLKSAEALLKRVKELTESNPMLGTRGCRLGLLFPEIYEMQARAIVRAALKVKAEGGDPRPEIMIPLVGFAEELRRMRELVVEVAAEECEAAGIDFPIEIGTMIEVPRAAFVADQIAEHGDFFSFGTNDLTQMVLGLSRDDAEGKFLTQYLEDGVIDNNPFQTLDVDGVGAVVRMGCELGRKTKPNIKLGVCGEHGGDPASVRFFHDVGVTYVSCSPFRVPIARLAAAQAALASTFKDR